MNKPDHDQYPPKCSKCGEHHWDKCPQELKDLKKKEEQDEIDWCAAAW